MTFYNFQRSLAAVLLGNLIYFLAMPVLPLALRHNRQWDLGLLVDFAICSAIYVLFGKLFPENKRTRQNSHL